MPSSSKRFILEIWMKQYLSNFMNHLFSNWEKTYSWKEIAIFYSVLLAIILIAIIFHP